MKSSFYRYKTNGCVKKHPHTHAQILLSFKGFLLFQNLFLLLFVFIDNTFMKLLHSHDESRREKKKYMHHIVFPKVGKGKKKTSFFPPKINKHIYLSRD